MKFKSLFIFLCLTIAMYSCIYRAKQAVNKPSKYELTNKPKLEKEVVNAQLGKSVAGRTFYIDNVATNGNGTEASPWNINAISSSSLLAGDIVYLKRGKTYTSGLLTPKVSGVTFDAYGTGANPLLIGNGSTLGYLIYTDRNDITFRNIDITDPTISTTDRTILSKIQRAFTFEGTGCKIINSKISLVGVAAYWVGSGNLMDSCDIGNLRMVVNTNDGGQPGADDDFGANPLVVSSSNNIITNNYFHDNWANSYDYTYDGGAIEFYNRSDVMNGNLVSHNTIVDGIGLTEVTGNSSNNTYSFNKIINNGSLFYFQSGYSYNNWQFINNAVVENVPSRVPESRLIGGAAHTMVFRSNIFQMSNGIDVASNATGIDHSDNIYTMSNSSTVNYPLGTNEYALPSVFINSTGNPLAWNYDLKAGTPSIGYVSLNSGTITPPPPPPTCIPRDSTRTIACPIGQTGTITQKCTFICPDGKWSDWVITSSNCVTPSPSTSFISNDANFIYLNAPKQGTYRLFKGTGAYFYNQVKTGSYPIGVSKISISSLAAGTYTFRTNYKNYTITK